MRGGHGRRPARWWADTLTGGRWAKLAVSLAAVWILVGRIDREALGQALGAARLLPLLAGFALYVLGQALSAYRWLLIAQRVGFRQPFATVVGYYLIGMFFNLFGPSTLGGDFVRGMYLAAPDGRRLVALNTVLFDRLTGLVMLVALVVAALAAFGGFGLPAPLVAAVAATGIVLVCGWWAVPPLARLVLPGHSRLRRLVALELGPFWNDRRLLVAVSVLSLGFHVWQLLSVALVAAAAGVQVPWQYYFVFHPLVSIVSALPISLAGLGVREVGYVYFLADVGGVPGEIAAAFAILWLGVMLASAVVGGIVFAASGAQLPPLAKAKAKPSRAG